MIRNLNLFIYLLLFLLEGLVFVHSLMEKDEEMYLEWLGMIICMDLLCALIWHSCKRENSEFSTYRKIMLCICGALNLVIVIRSFIFAFDSPEVNPYLKIILQTKWFINPGTLAILSLVPILWIPYCCCKSAMCYDSWWWCSATERAKRREPSARSSIQERRNPMEEGL